MMRLRTPRLSSTAPFKKCLRSYLARSGVIKPDASLVKSVVIYPTRNVNVGACRRGLIKWEDKKPKTALIVKKRHNPQAAEALENVGDWLTKRDIRVCIEKNVYRDEFRHFDVFKPGETDVDLCVTLGGDGTVLHMASLFAEDLPLPPVISFAMGTLGFLTPFDVNDFAKHISRVLAASEHEVECTLRSRKKCEVITPTGKIKQVSHVLNECIIDRGGSQSTITVAFEVDGAYVASVCADGLIVATPSGSTAYSMTAGGPMVAPSVPCTIITPVAPLSLSFRPLVIPESSTVDLILSPDSKSIARASLDGRRQVRLLVNSRIRLTPSIYPLPLVNIGKYDADWYKGITQKLKWNQSIVEPSTKPHNHLYRHHQQDGYDERQH